MFGVIVDDGCQMGGGAGGEDKRRGRHGRSNDNAGDQRGVDLLVAACVMTVFGVSQEELFRPTRGPARIALARQVAMYLHHVILARSLSAVAVRFGRDRTTVAHACQMIEERRDSSEFDALVISLEMAIADGLKHLRGTRAGEHA